MARVVSVFRARCAACGARRAASRAVVLGGGKTRHRMASKPVTGNGDTWMT